MRYVNLVNLDLNCPFPAWPVAITDAKSGKVVKYFKTSDKAMKWLERNGYKAVLQLPSEVPRNGGAGTENVTLTSGGT